MKSILTFSLFLISYSFSFGQITLTGDTHVPNEGDQFWQITVDGGVDLSSGPSGENVSWDYSGFGNMPSIQSLNINVVPPSELNNISIFPSTNNGGTYYDNGDREFFNMVSDTEYASLGFALQRPEGLYTTDYAEDPKVTLKFPFTYGDFFEDTYQGTRKSPSIYTFFRTGMDAYEADAYGTLITPSGTFTNVLRVKQTEDYVDIADVDNAAENVRKRIRFIWYSLETAYPILRLNYYLNEDDDSIEYTTVSYLDAYVVETNNTLANEIQLQLVPNPANDLCTIQFELKEKANINICLVNIIGQSMLNISSGAKSPGYYKEQVDISSIANGTYFVRMVVDDQVSSKRLVVQR